MAVDPNQVINFAKLSWKELRPDKDYDVTLQTMPEVIKKHEEIVQCYIENSYDPVRVIKIKMGFKQGFDDLEDNAKEFHQRLTECLKRLSRQYMRATKR